MTEVLGVDGAGNDVLGICHSIVTDGAIHFAADSTHKLAGQTLPLEDF